MSMSSNDGKHQILNELYVKASSDLLSAYGLTVQILEQQGVRGRNTASYVSFLSANSDGIRLSSILKIDRDVVASLHPMGAEGIAPADLEDWCRELNNQLVGRLKNKLLGYGHVVMVGLPVLIVGTDVSPVAEPNTEVHEYSMESAHGHITLTLSTLIDPAVDLHKEETSMDDEAVQEEGMIALF
jgi:hypothetical protein